MQEFYTEPSCLLRIKTRDYHHREAQGISHIFVLLEKPCWMIKYRKLRDEVK
jgi:hypothetical protein